MTEERKAPNNGLETQVFKRMDFNGVQHVVEVRTINYAEVTIDSLLEQNRSMVATMLNIHDYAKVVSINLLKIKEKLTEEELKRIGKDLFAYRHLKQVDEERLQIDARLKTLENDAIQQANAAIAIALQRDKI